MVRVLVFVLYSILFYYYYIKHSEDVRDINGKRIERAPVRKIPCTNTRWEIQGPSTIHLGADELSKCFAWVF